MNRKGRRSSSVLEDVPELMHQIQSRLHIKEAARTSVLSKSWLHAWSTIPTLRFCVLREQKRKQQQVMKLVDVEHTLIRYLRDNIPIESFDLKIDIENQEAASLAEKWIRSVATKTSLKELSLTVRLYGASLHLPEEILSGENLTKLKLVSGYRDSVTITSLNNTKCVSLKELHLSSVRISEEVLHHILSSCSLLVKIELLQCSRDIKTIKVTNLPFLNHLHIYTFDRGSTALEINHVPSLRFLICNVHMFGRSKRPLIKAHSISLGSNVTKLTLGGGVITDNESLDMFLKSGLPFLENLKLNMECWMLESLCFTCTSIKRLSLFECPRRLVDVVHVNAPNLRFFSFSGDIISLPSLLFPVSTDLERMELHLALKIPRLDASFFIKMREALTLSSTNKYQVRIKLKASFDNQPLNIDVDDLRARLPFPPAMNVQRLLVKTVGDECLWERSPFFDAFFEICHPEHVIAKPDMKFKNNNHFCKLILKEVLEKSKTTTMAYWRPYLKDVRVRIGTNRHHKWETLTVSHKGFLEEPTTTISVQFLLNWH